MPTYAAVLSGSKRLLAEFHELVGVDKALPTFADDRRGINSTGGSTTGIPRGAICTGAISRAGNAQLRGQKCVFFCSRQVLGDDRRTASRIASRTANTRAVHRTTGVVHHVRSCVFVTRGVGFDHVPVEQREHLVETGKAVQVGAVEVREATVFVPNVGGDQGKSGLAIFGNAVAVRIKERPGVQVRLPRMNSNVAHVLSGLIYPNGSGDAVHDHVIPLVEDGYAPVAGGRIKAEGSISITLRECKVGTVRAAQTDIALRVSEHVAGFAAVESLIWSA